jgi:hypothetical protein
MKKCKTNLWNSLIVFLKHVQIKDQNNNKNQSQNNNIKRINKNKIYKNWKRDMNNKEEENKKSRKYYDNKIKKSNLF